MFYMSQENQDIKNNIYKMCHYVHLTKYMYSTVNTSNCMAKLQNIVPSQNKCCVSTVIQHILNNFK